MLTYRWVYALALSAVFAAGCMNAPHVGGSGGNDADGGPESGPGHLKACLYNGDTEIACSHNTQMLVVDRTSMPVGLGTTLHWKLKLISDGSGSITVNSFGATEAADISFAPSTDDFQAVTLGPREASTIDVTIAPTIGGYASTTLIFQTTDTANPTFTVVLDWVGDGPAICLCLRRSEGSMACKPTTSIDFDTIRVGLSGDRFIRLASCGTQPVTLTKVELTNADSLPIFSATGLPADGATLESSAAPIDARLTFAPTQQKTYAGSDGGGRLRIETSNQHLLIDLSGTGGKAGCRLEAATTMVDFGQGAVGATTQRILALANQGTEECTFPEKATITQGGVVRFEVVNTPPTSLPPGQTTRVTLAYTPQDTVGPDAGEVTIPFADGSGMGALVVALKGTPVAAASCRLEVQPAGSMTFGRTLDFGQVPVYATRTLPIQLKNVGSAPCLISNVRIIAGLFASTTPASDFQIVAMPTTPLAPGDAAVVDVAFTPSALSSGPFGMSQSGTSAYGINLTLQTNDMRFTGQECAVVVSGGVATPGCIGWGLSGKGGGSEVTILPTNVDFGPVVGGCQSDELSVTLYNTGTAPVQVTGITLDPVTQPPIFSVSPGTVPFTLNPGDSRTISLRYIPPNANPHSATLRIAINNTFTTIGIQGRGALDFHQTDTFSQSSAPKTDVLFVVDTEGSMSEEQLLLANKAQVIVEEATRLGTDFQIAVVSADMVTSGQGGLFQGTPGIIKPGANAISQLTAMLSGLGTNGSGTSQGLEAMFRALSPPLINNPSMNGGFLRSGARLAVIVVSDRADASPGAPALYTDFLRNVKGPLNESLVSLSAIVGDAPGGCTSPNGTAVAGDRYLQVQQSTGGTFHSICSNDWLALAQALGQGVFAAQSAFKLSQGATASTIAVRVNGVVSPSTDWTYDATTNIVTFLPSAIPMAGATVSIDYDMMCL